MRCGCGTWLTDCPRHLAAERERLRLREQEAKIARDDFELWVQLTTGYRGPDEELVPGPAPEWMVS